MNVKEKVYSFKTKNKQGFTHKELKELLKEFPKLNMEKFNNALTGITVMVIEEEMVIYHCDIEKGLICGLENRDLHSYEID